MKGYTTDASITSLTTSIPKNEVCLQVKVLTSSYHPLCFARSLINWGRRQHTKT